MIVFEEKKSICEILNEYKWVKENVIFDFWRFYDNMFLSCMYLFSKLYLLLIFCIFFESCWRIKLYRNVNLN